MSLIPPHHEIVLDTSFYEWSEIYSELSNSNTFPLNFRQQLQLSN